MTSIFNSNLYKVTTFWNCPYGCFENRCFYKDLHILLKDWNENAVVEGLITFSFTFVTLFVILISYIIISRL